MWLAHQYRVLNFVAMNCSCGYILFIDIVCFSNKEEKSLFCIIVSCHEDTIRSGLWSDLWLLDAYNK